MTVMARQLIKNVKFRVNPRFKGKVTATGLRQLQKMGAAIERIAKQFVSGPSPSAPGHPPGLITGRLRGSIVSSVNKQLKQVTVRARARYGKWLESGTRFMKARPFLRPALVWSRARWKQWFKDVI